MKSAELKVQERTVGNRSETRRLRRVGMVPAIVYGPDSGNIGCSFDERDLKRAFKGHFNLNTILTLQSDSKTLGGRRVIVKSVERDPVKWTMDHVDLYEISDKRPITIKVPLEYKGIPVGVKLGGGILQIVRREISIEALPTNIPEKIEVDISGLELNTSLHLSDVTFAAGLRVVDALTSTLASVAEPEKEEVVAAVAATAEGAAAATATATGTGAAAATAAGTGAAAKPDAPAKK